MVPAPHARLPETAYFAIAPDWICEIVSPSTASLDRVKKLAIYARAQVSHAWLIDPIARTLEVFGLAGARWTILATHADAETVRAEPFTEVELDLKALWDDPPAPGMRTTVDDDVYEAARSLAARGT